MRKPAILVFAGSIRSGAYSQKTADAYAAQLAGMECEVTRITLADYPLPIMDEDLEKEKGMPENAVKLARQFARHDGIVMVTPEYNGSLPPLLKNAIDWVSRVSSDGDKPLVPYRDKLAVIASSSNGVMGGYSALTHLRHILVRLGMQVLSEQMALGRAGSAFDDIGRLSGDREAGILESACRSLVEKAALLARI